ncbi:DUF2273 domain-containing protein [Exiguobacterium chiriqhucha]|uniref:Small integral membrane protein n=1 Tax=Exiguobacterium chiriqhucha RW-2 TaxID=1345023 RepID=U1N117_9BACL|nr:DUF2273 domain-containing protein [Exiguobacterium chiriqhucha]ERG67696.1 hypothetical protein M467_10430 [Exiguobacterium chiriqhucha RW-2]
MDTKTILFPYRFRLIGIVVGVVIAVLFLTIGFGQTVLIVTLALVGFLIGKWGDGALHVNEWVEFFIRKQRR